MDRRVESYMQESLQSSAYCQLGWAEISFIAADAADCSPASHPHPHPLKNNLSHANRSNGYNDHLDQL